LKMFLSVILAILCLGKWTNALLLPGSPPHDYQDGDTIDVVVDSLTSLKTFIPLDYFGFNFCGTGEDRIPLQENLGMVMSGSKTYRISLFKIAMMQNVECESLCKLVIDPWEKGHDVAGYQRLADGYYKMNMIIDDLPVMTDGGFQPAYFSHSRELSLITHFHFVIRVSPKVGGEEGTRRIVGVEILSLEDSPQCKARNSYLLGTTNFPSDNPIEVPFTYSVTFLESNITWTDRWDRYLEESEQSVIDKVEESMNSVVMVLGFGVLVAYALSRALNKDFLRYNMLSGEASEEEKIALSLEAAQDSGWKQIRGDIFRAPSYPVLFTSLIGTGVHLSLMILLYMVFATFGFLNPSNRGSEVLGFIIIWTLLSFVAGYVSARLLKSFNLPNMDWKVSIGLTTVLYPTILYSLCFILDLSLWGVQSTAAIPLSSMILLLTMFFLINAPLSFLGSRMGFTKDSLVIPIEPVDLIPRPIDMQPWYLESWFILPVASLVPFVNIFLFFENLIVSTLYGQYFYYFGFALIAFTSTILITAEVSIVISYVQICHENHRWWWRSFFISAFTGVWCFIYMMVYFASRDSLSGLTFYLFATVSFLASFTLALSLGACGFVGTYYFMRYIYGNLRA